MGWLVIDITGDGTTDEKKMLKANLLVYLNDFVENGMHSML